MGPFGSAGSRRWMPVRSTGQLVTLLSLQANHPNNPNISAFSPQPQGKEDKEGVGMCWGKQKPLVFVAAQACTRVNSLGIHILGPGVAARNDQTHSMSRPNELFIAWLTGSGFSEEGWNRGFQTQALRSFLPCHPDGGDQVFPSQDILKQIAVTPFRAHSSAPVLSGKGACENWWFGLHWQIF